MSSLDELGGPASVDVLVDYGATGTRGTQFFLSSGDPNIPGNIDQNVFLFTPIEYDLCINIKPDDPNYLDVYQYLYIQQLGVSMWVVGLQLAPALVVEKKAYTFVPGSLVGGFSSMGYTLVDPIVLSVDPALAATLYALPQEQRNQAFISQANITYEIYNQKPVSPIIVTGDISVDLATSEITIPVTIAALEYDATLGWVPLLGEKTVSIVLGISAS